MIYPLWGCCTRLRLVVITFHTTSKIQTQRLCLGKNSITIVSCLFVFFKNVYNLSLYYFDTFRIKSKNHIIVYN